MVDPPTAAKGLLSAAKIGRALGPLVQSYLGRDTKTLQELMRAGDIAWVAEFCELLRKEQEVLEERLRELHPLITSLRWEAARDATTGRRSLLAHVAADLLNSNDSVEDKARVERLIRELDPVDVGLLAWLGSLPAEAAFKEWEHHPRRSNLGQCIDVDYRPLAGFGGGGKPTLQVSQSGWLLLRAVQDFNAATLLHGFDVRRTGVDFDEWISEAKPTVPFWLARCNAVPLRVIEIEPYPTFRAEAFRWNDEHQAYVLAAAVQHHKSFFYGWSVLHPKSEVRFLRQDNERDGRPLITCDPNAPPSKFELEFVNLREQ